LRHLVLEALERLLRLLPRGLHLLATVGDPLLAGRLDLLAAGDEVLEELAAALEELLALLLDEREGAEAGQEDLASGGGDVGGELLRLLLDLLGLDLDLLDGHGFSPLRLRVGSVPGPGASSPSCRAAAIITP